MQKEFYLEKENVIRNIEKLHHEKEEKKGYRLNRSLQNPISLRLK